MKKSLIALAVLSASSVAFAASNVTLYGVVDASAVVSKAGGQDTTVSMNSGFRNGSRWGIRGVEELGNGYAVGFILEQGYNMDTGNENTTGKQFSRESKLYVQGNFGQLGFGRLGSLAGGAQSNNMLTGWALGTSYGGGSWTSIARNSGTRLDNAIAYGSPEFGGLKVSAMYSNGVVADDNGKKWSDNTHYYGIGAQYTLGGFKNSLIFEAVDNKGQADAGYSLAKSDKTAYLINLGLGYDFGTWTPMFAYQYNWQDEGVKANIFGLSAAVKLGGGTAKLGARYAFGKNDGALEGAEDKLRVWTLNAAYEYPLSKRTTAWVYGGYADGSKGLKKEYTKHMKASDAVNYNGFQFAVGMTHNF